MPLTIYAKQSVFDVWQGSKYASVTQKALYSQMKSRYSEQLSYAHDLSFVNESFAGLHGKIEPLK